MSTPLVSVICLCYNHERFVEEAILSAIDQTYPHVEIIIVDDASQDNSVTIIKQLLKRYPEIKFISLDKNVGNCSAFNIGFAQSKGEYIVDFAADDILLNTRIEEGVKALQQVDGSYGVQFSDAELIDENGVKLGLHSDKYPHAIIPSGDIYLDIIQRYFICAPSMLIKREVLETLNGYDESLAYEDFDFWVRSSRHFNYLYLSKVLVKRRVLSGSMRSHQFKRGSKQLASTFVVCQKIQKLNKTWEEKSALKRRVAYELKVCLKLWELRLAWRYALLLFSI